MFLCYNSGTGRDVFPLFHRVFNGLQAVWVAQQFLHGTAGHDLKETNLGGRDFPLKHGGRKSSKNPGALLGCA